MTGGYISSGGGKGYPGKLTGHALLTAFVGAANGLIFGYDIGISGGVTSMPVFLKKFFPDVYRKQVADVGGTNQYCKFDNFKLTMFTSSLYLAALFAACFIASFITRKLGRKISMITAGFLFLVGAIFNAFAHNVEMLIAGRVFLGLGIGFGNQSAPVYLSEMAPYKHRGACNMLFQLSITIGIFAANILNYFMGKRTDDLGWRISLGCAAIPGLMCIVGSLFLSETPNSLMERGNEDEAKKQLIKIRGTPNVDEEFNDMKAASIAAKNVMNPWYNLFWNKQYRPHIVFCSGIPFFQQLTGMNVIMFYAPVLFQTLSFGNRTALLSAVITGGVNFVSTFASILLVDKVGRRKLFLVGGLLMLFCQIVIATAIGLKFGTDGNPGIIPTWYAILVVFFICLFVSSFAWSWGPLGWLVPSEILPLEIRSAGQSVNVGVNMTFTFFIAQIFMKMMCKLKFGMFIFFAFFVICATIFIAMFLPETKGIPIEEMQEIWVNHKRWKKYVVQDNGNDDNKNGGDIKQLPV